MLHTIDPDTAGMDPAVLTAPAPPGAPTDLVPVRGMAAKTLMRAETPAVLVLGVCGGAGTTVTTLGLAAAAATRTDAEQDPVCVDATAFGGDLALRGADAHTPISTLQSWLTSPNPELPSAVAECSGMSSTGARVMPRTADPLPRRETMSSVHLHLTQAGALPLYDAGAPVANRGIAPLLADPRVALLLVTTARPDAINKLKPALSWLDDHYGEFLVSRVVLAITEQIPGTGAAARTHVQTWVGSWVRTVSAIPFDPHLAAGQLVAWDKLAGATRQAFRLLLGDLQ
ncbi:hypothetical protein OHB26_38835 (plasmid) [Nocardia sp. NBC_01503]|uniref:hypothetical protein n=1 Tax=Nocardia sp. NBC_01503 TaxID=2975997 RepID=UPI002E7B4162|nr:hypothetical protein [Nocardia sp. NBC_01503]WTL36635.1 hypothetical protein OHB26_38835 [Nocardia sp. NBC_01503]